MSGNTTLGNQVLESRGLHFDDYFYWISFGALMGFTLLFNIGFTLALTFLKCKCAVFITLSSMQKCMPSFC